MASTGTKVTFLLRLDKEVLDRLRTIAEEKELPLSQLLREALNNYLDDAPKPEKRKALKHTEKEKKKWWM
tara:strand:+ start:852 stop:1061 length:210 start_codon:yes stop_codon:yes gene_type:complete